MRLHACLTTQARYAKSETDDPDQIPQYMQETAAPGQQKSKEEHDDPEKHHLQRRIRRNRRWALRGCGNSLRPEREREQTEDQENAHDQHQENQNKYKMPGAKYVAHHLLSTSKENTRQVHRIPDLAQFAMKSMARRWL